MSSRRIRGRLLISVQSGDPTKCAECPSGFVTKVIRYNIDYVNLKDFMVDEDFTKDHRKMLSKKYPKEADQKFLCENCWRVNWYNNGMNYDEDGQADFASMTLASWRKRDWLRVEDAVAKVTVDGYI